MKARQTHLGTTPSGKKIYLERLPSEYPRFSAEDHSYAAVIHGANRTDGGKRAAQHREAARGKLHGGRAHAAIASTGTDKPSKEKFQQAAKWIRKELTKRDDGRSHPSHLAAKVLEEADAKFQLGSYGVEGWAKSPSLGYQYLNYGDTYDPTIVIRSNPTRATVIVALGGWGSYA